MDSHNCQRVVQSGAVRNEGDFQAGTPAPYAISYRSIVPAQAECENLFVPFCLSASHVSFGSNRMEPVFMITSQSAATAACFAIDGGVAVQQVDYEKLKRQLLADGQLLTWGTTDSSGIIVDNADATGVTLTGAWITSTSTAGFFGANYLHDNNELKGTKSVRFTPSLPNAGSYQVFVRWTEHTNRASNAPFDLITPSGTQTFIFNQRTQGAQWVPLGTFNLPAGTGTSVVVRNTGTDGYVIADAVRFLPSGTEQAVDIIASNPLAAERGLKTGKVSIVRIGDTSLALTVNLQIAGTAAAASDYTTVASSVMIPAGSASRSIAITPLPDALVEGPETVVLTIAPGSGYQAGSFNSATVTIRDLPLDAWKAQHFTPAELNQPEVSGLDADPNGNGRINFLDYALGLDPRAGVVGAVPIAARTELGGQEYLTLVFSRPYPPPPDVSYVIQRSENLQDWLSGASVVVESSLTPEGDRQTIIARDLLPMSASPARYLRLRLAPQ